MPDSTGFECLRCGTPILAVEEQAGHALGRALSVHGLRVFLCQGCYSDLGEDDDKVRELFDPTRVP